MRGPIKRHVPRGWSNKPPSIPRDSSKLQERPPKSELDYSLLPYPLPLLLHCCKYTRGDTHACIGPTIKPPCYARWTASSSPFISKQMLDCFKGPAPKRPNFQIINWREGGSFVIVTKITKIHYAKLVTKQTNETHSQYLHKVSSIIIPTISQKKNSKN